MTELEEYAGIKKALSKASEELLKSKGHTWQSFKELEKRLETLDPGEYQTSSGIVQVHSIPIYAHATTKLISHRSQVHFIRRA